jgi:tetratricopeptide (TPR) repeat protein
MEKAKDVQDFIALQRMAIASNPECGTSHYNLGVALMGLKQYDEAEKHFREAIDCSPGLAEAYVQLVGICLKRGDLDGCLSFNRQAVKARPGFSEGHGNIGFIHMQRGEIDEAIVSLERAVAFNFRFIQAFTTLANAYLMAGRVKDSIETNLKALKLDPDFAVAHNNLALAYMENKEFDKAVMHCDKAVSLGYEVAPEIIADLEPHR